VNALNNFVPVSFHAKKLRSRLSSRNVHCRKRNFCWVFEPPPGALEASYAIHLTLIGKPVCDFLLANIVLFQSFQSHSFKVTADYWSMCTIFILLAVSTTIKFAFQHVNSRHSFKAMCNRRYMHRSRKYSDWQWPVISSTNRKRAAGWSEHTHTERRRDNCVLNEAP